MRGQQNLSEISSAATADHDAPNDAGETDGSGVSNVNEEQLKIAVFIDFDNIQIGVRGTLNRDFDLALVLEALKERGEVVTKIAYGN